MNLQDRVRERPQTQNSETGESPGLHAAPDEARCSSSARVQGLGLRLLEDSWVVISGVISRVTVVITHIRGLNSRYNYP